MRRNTPTRAAADRKAKQARLEFFHEFGEFMACGNQVNLEIHEIARGPHRGQAFGERCAWLLLCRFCHVEFGDYSAWPLEMQYALKALRDPEHFDRLRLNELRGRAENSISEQEVWLALRHVIQGTRDA